MGVRELTSFCYKNAEAASTSVDLVKEAAATDGGISLMVDGDGFVYRILARIAQAKIDRFGPASLPYLFDYNFEEYEEAVIAFCDTFTRYNISLKFVFDSFSGDASDEAKFQTRMDRFADHVQDVLRYAEEPPRKGKLDNIYMHFGEWAFTQMKAAIGRCPGTTMSFPIGEADGEIAAAVAKGGPDAPFAVVAEDSDFFVFKDCRYMPFSLMKGPFEAAEAASMRFMGAPVLSETTPTAEEEEDDDDDEERAAAKAARQAGEAAACEGVEGLSGRMFTPALVAEALAISPEQLVEVAMACGNDYTKHMMTDPNLHQPRRIKKGKQQPLREPLPVTVANLMGQSEATVFEDVPAMQALMRRHAGLAEAVIFSRATYNHESTKPEEEEEEEAEAAKEEGEGEAGSEGEEEEEEEEGKKVRLRPNQAASVASLSSLAALAQAREAAAKEAAARLKTDSGLVAWAKTAMTSGRLPSELLQVLCARKEVLVPALEPMNICRHQCQAALSLVCLLPLRRVLYALLGLGSRGCELYLPVCLPPANKTALAKHQVAADGRFQKLSPGEGDAESRAALVWRAVRGGAEGERGADPLYKATAAGSAAKWVPKGEGVGATLRLTGLALRHMLEVQDAGRTACPLHLSSRAEASMNRPNWLLSKAEVDTVLATVIALQCWRRIHSSSKKAGEAGEEEEEAGAGAVVAGICQEVFEGEEKQQQQQGALRRAGVASCFLRVAQSMSQLSAIVAASAPASAKGEEETGLLAGVEPRHIWNGSLYHALASHMLAPAEEGEEVKEGVEVQTPRDRLPAALAQVLGCTEKEAGKIASAVDSFRDAVMPTPFRFAPKESRSTSSSAASKKKKKDKKRSSAASLLLIEESEEEEEEEEEEEVVEEAVKEEVVAPAAAAAAAAAAPAVPERTLSLKEQKKLDKEKKARELDDLDALLGEMGIETQPLPPAAPAAKNTPKKQGGGGKSGGGKKKAGGKKKK